MAVRKIHSETSQSIIDGAIAVMADSGLRHLTTKLVSEHANVSTASIHYFFDTKERLIHESFAHIMDEMWDRLVEVNEQGGEPLISLRRIMETFLVANRNGVNAVKIWPQLWHHAGANDETGELFREYNARVVGLLADKLIEAGLDIEKARLYAFRLNALHRGLWIELHVGTVLNKTETDKIYTSIFNTINAEIMGNDHE